MTAWLAAGLAVTSDDRPVAWITADGERLTYGSGTQIHLTTSNSPATVRTIELPEPVTDAVQVGDQLYVVVDGDRLARLVPDGRPEIETVELQPPPRGRLVLSRMDDYLLVAEDGFGIRLLELPGHHGDADELPAPTGVLEYSGRFEALTA